MGTLRNLPPQRSRWMMVLVVGLATVAIIRMLSQYASQWHRQLTYSEFYHMLQDNGTSGEITEARLINDQVRGQLKNGTSFSVYIPPRDEEVVKLLRQHVGNFDVQPAQSGFFEILMALSPWIIFLVIMWLVMRSTQGGGRLLSFGKSRARLISPEPNTRVTFDDVAGIDEAKEELKEIIEFLKDPKRFQRLGG